MRLTNYIRQAFVTAAMADVPKEDYQAQAEKLARESLEKLFYKDFPKEVSYKWAQTSSWFSKGSVNLPGALPNIYGLSKSYQSIQVDDPQTWKKLEEIEKKFLTQAQQRSELQVKLEGVANSCTTRKALAEALPEFKKYLPAEEQTSRNLPAIANVVSDFVKAGWPKQNQGKIAAAKAAA